MDLEQERLWALLNELSKQLSSNRVQTEALQRQAEDLKVQAVHNGTGFILRRFNVDISQETFESELERLNATLVLENQSLQHENKQLSMLLKDYEGTLESVMARFRTFAHCTQQHDLQLTRHYESLLDSAAPPQTTLPNGNSNEIPLVQDPTAVEASLFRIASLLRKAYRSLQGEDPSPPSSPSLSEPDSALSLFGIAPAEDLNAKLGGYLALLGAGTRDEVIDNDSLERDIELERLRQENEQLRQMLAISNQDDSSSDFL